MEISFRNLSGERLNLSDFMPEDEVFHSMIIEIDKVEYIIKETQGTLDIHMDGQMILVPRASNAVWIVDAESTHAKR